MGIYDRDYYRDDDLRPIRPWDNSSAVTMLIVANLAVFVANFLLTSRSNGVNNLLMLQASDLLDPLHWPRFLSYAFVHSGMRHILFNMLGLYFLGQGVESKYGKWEFFRFYLIAGILCGLLWSAVRVGTGTGGALLGASGATTAVAMLFVFSFPRSTLHLYGVVPVKAWVLGVIIIGTNVLGTQSGVTESGAPQVAFDVHLMGAAFAAIYFYGQLNFSFFEGLSGGAKLKFKQRRSGLKVHRPSDDDATDSLLAKDEAESDRILEKILREGKDSLTKKEAAFMQQYSRKVRERRAQQ
ncbi:MAG: rhomboid family intramembrane serine protease [Planctomycetales bacterium]|nr:rhomboid family intramembrane serine protease [Planctomycetales bacterium]